MKASQLFFKTHKETPADCDTVSHQLMERAGFIRRLGRGLYSYTPLMQRVMRKLTGIIRQELDRVGCQEVLLPQLQPSQIWKDSGRWSQYRAENLLYTLQDREKSEYCLGPTHEEVVTLLVKNWLTSYKQLPVNLYQISNKFRDEIRPRFGLMRAKEFMMKDAYAFCASPMQMDQQYALMRQAYSRIFDRLELRYAIVEADGGSIGKGRSEEFQVLADVGEDAILVTQGHAANVEALKAIPPQYVYKMDHEPSAIVSTPSVDTIEKLTSYLKVPSWLILKTVLYKALFEDREEFVAVCIRGDREVNDVKFKNLLNCLELELASEQDLMRIAGVKPGFLGPKDLGVRVFADDSVERMCNFIMAVNQDDVHMTGCRWGRELDLPDLHDLLLAKEGDTHPTQGSIYQAFRGIEVGHIFNLGEKYSQALGAFFIDAQGQAKPYYMGCYGIGVGRLVASVIEQRHDDRGILWPKALAPFACLISSAKMNEPSWVDQAHAIYTLLQDHGFEVLLDDRDERLGFKLKDSDLIGLPYKIIVGAAFGKEGLLEVEPRVGEKLLLTQDQLLEWAKNHL